MEKDFINWIEKEVGKPISMTKEAHGDEGVVYEINTIKGNYFLKIKKGSTFLKEYERLTWLKGKLPVPAVVGFTEKAGMGAMLLTALPGKNLAVLCKEWSVEKVINKLAEILLRFHSTNVKNFPFRTADSNKVLIHGDACLPNFIFAGDNFSGYVDLADLAVADVEIDLAASIWSLQYNLGRGYGAKFLKKYGYKNATEETAEKLRLQYENYQRAHGFLS